MCRATISATPPKPGRFTPKCPKCGEKFVVQISVSTLDQNRTDTPSTTSFAEPGRTVTSVPRSAVPTDPNATFASAASSAASHETEPETTRPSVPQPDTDDTDAERTAVTAEAKSRQKTADADDEMPDQLGGYEILKQLGRGGMGAVYLARQLSLDRPVALKVMNPEWADDPSFLARFIREAYAAAQLTHHNVIQIYELARDADVNYFSMEYVDGKSLGDLLRKRGKLSANEAVGYVLQAAQGLRYAHDRGMVHRDIKPDNLMLNSEGVVKVADLGLVKTRGLTAKEDRAPNAGPKGQSGSALRDLPDVTRVGSAMGSPSYMAPEQCQDATAVDGRADQYSLGCTLYALLAGRAPFQGKTTVELISQHLNEPPPPLHQFAADVPKGLAEIVGRTLAKQPEQRYSGMSEFLAALKNWQAEQSSGPPKPTEAQLAAFEALTQKLDAAPTAKLARLVGWVGPLVGLMAAVIALPFSPIAAGAIVVGILAAVIGGFVTTGLLTGSYLFRKVREWVFGARIVDWLTVAVAVLLFVLGLYFAGLLLVGVIAIAVGVGAGVGYAYLLAKRAHDHTLDTKEEIEQLTKRFRLAGMDEDAVRTFLVENAGDRWERVFETLYGYPAKIQARGLFADRVANRPRYAAWRDPIVNKLDAALEQRKQAQAKKLLQRVEAAKLKAEGMSEAEAAERAEDAAAELVEQAKEIRAANLDRKRKVNVHEIMTRYEIAKSAPRRPRVNPVVRLVKKIVAIPLDPRLRLLLGAALIVGGLMWFQQNTNLETVTANATEVQSTADAAKKAQGAWEVIRPLVLNPEKAKPLQVGGLPGVVTGFFNSANPILAGLLLVLSALSSRGMAVLVMAIGAAVAFAVHQFGIPEMGPLKPAHLTAIVGLGIGAVGWFLGRR
jgi:serine/threonine protein kinase